MCAGELRTQINAVVAKHAVAAQASQYDRTVAITAVATARGIIEEILSDESIQNYGEQVLSALKSLLQTYNDPDGQYTNGRGIIGSLLGDMEAVVRKVGSS